MEKREKRKLSTLFSDKRFLVALSVLLVGTAFLVYQLNPKSDPGVPASGGLNVGLPQAREYPPKSKLELQAERGQPDRVAMPGIAGATPADSQRLRAEVPGSVVPYLYGARPSSPKSMPVEAVPEPVPARLATPRKASPHADELPESVTPLGEPGDEPLAKPANAEAAEKRLRLLALLEEYKRDKEARRRQQQADLKPRPVGGPVPVTSLEGSATGARNGFYGLYSDAQRREHRASLDSVGTALRAVVFGDQTVTHGGRVRLQLLQPVALRDVVIPAGTLVYGLGQFGAERIAVRITGIRFEDRLYPVQLTVFDMDGIEGVYVPSVAGVQETRQATAQAAGGINLYPPVGGQNVVGIAAATAAQAGSTGLRSLLQRKASQPKARLKGNYYVLLR
jgi:hypothetical protein